MTNPVAVNAYAVGVGTAPNVSMVPFVTNVAPAATNIKGPNGPFRIGQSWVDTTGLVSYTLVGLASSVGTVSATWALSAGGNGTLSTLTGNSGGAISPVAGNISILGSSGVTVVGTAGTLTISLTGGGTAIDSFAPDAGTNPVVPDGAGLVTMAGTANQITTTGGTNSLTFSVPSTFIAPGTIASTTTVTAGTALVATTSVTAGTSITATAGDITATLGNVIINGAAKQLRVHGGAVTDFIGTAVLVNGTVTVANTNIAATDRIMVSRSAANASTALGVFTYSISAATSFTITALNVTDATTQTNDVSTVAYFIVRQV